MADFGTERRDLAQHKLPARIYLNILLQPGIIKVLAKLYQFYGYATCTRKKRNESSFTVPLPLSLFSPRSPLALIACTYIRTYVNTHVCTFRKFIQLHPNSSCSYKQDIMTMTFLKIANKFLILTLSKCYKVTNDIFV